MWTVVTENGDWEGNKLHELSFRIATFYWEDINGEYWGLPNIKEIHFYTGKWGDERYLSPREIWVFEQDMEDWIKYFKQNR